VYKLFLEILCRATTFKGPNSNSLLPYFVYGPGNYTLETSTHVTSSYGFSGIYGLQGKKHNSRGETTNCSSCDEYTKILRLQIFQRQLQLVLETDGAHTVHISPDFHLPTVLSVTHNTITSIIYCMKSRKIKSGFSFGQTLKVHHLT
jgi:hypothetical protein